MNTNNIPDYFYSGDSLAWEHNIDMYPASLFDCEYVLINNTGKETITTTKNGDSFVVYLAGVNTENFNSGFYKVYAILTDTTNKYTVEIKTIEIKESLTSANSKVIISHNRKVYESICAVIENRATYDQMSYSIQGRSLTRTPLKDLMYFKETYYNLVQQEEQKEKARLGIATKKKNKIYITYKR